MRLPKFVRHAALSTDTSTVPGCTTRVSPGEGPLLAEIVGPPNTSPGVNEYLVLEGMGSTTYVEERWSFSDVARRCSGTGCLLEPPYDGCGDVI